MIRRLALALALLAAPLTARAEVDELRIPVGAGGIGFLPLLVMEKQQLVEKHARAAGLDKLKVSWITFGGPTPFKAKSYQVKVPFTEASQLAEQSDVRISGVDVGKVESIELGSKGKEAVALLNIDDKYAPLPDSTRAMLRTKTLLGETYIELTPGSRKGAEMPDGGTLPEANVAESVQLDEIFRTFNAKTRAAFQTWQQEAAVAIEGQGASLSYAFG